ncbi:hypothetical protein NS330_00925 [Curtobacterium citreum]|nr:hypothetical protein NS330_00925 [Curtobacterium citreum]
MTRAASAGSSTSAQRGDPTDAAVRRLTAGLRLVEVPLSDGLCADVDEPADAARVTGTSGLLD